MFKKLFPVMMVLALFTACAPAPSPTPAPAATLPPTDAPTAVIPTATATARPPTNTPAPTPTPVPMGTVDGRIVFWVQGTERGGIWAMNGDGSDLVQLTKKSTGEDTFPRWSPDGEKIAFGCDDSYICVINADGSGLTALTDPTAAALNHAPDWSPDGSKIVYSSNLDHNENGNEEIYVMNTDGSGQTQLTDGPATDSFPDWSPDGNQIVFCSNRDGKTDLYLMNADGSEVSRLTEVGIGSVYAGYCFPRWSPDGAKILFSSSHETGHGEAYVINGDGSGLTCITCDIPGSQGGASWSPDGSQMLFGDDFGTIYVMNADGSALIRLTERGAGAPTDWKP
jgi:Tol biopolymer transport system component